MEMALLMALGDISRQLLVFNYVAYRAARAESSFCDLVVG
jgi:hypothetical protein